MDGATIGEIGVRGNVVMAGYYNDPEATERAMGDGWFKTGDAAVVHPDGYAEIRDRLKDVIISGGENISNPVEVERRCCCDIRRSRKRPWSDCLTRSGGKRRTPSSSSARAPRHRDEVRQFARDHMAHYKAPKSVTFVPDLPKTATGKIQKCVLRKAAGHRASISEGLRPSDSPTASLARRFAARSAPLARSPCSLAPRHATCSGHGDATRRACQAERAAVAHVDDEVVVVPGGSVPLTSNRT